MTRRSPPWTDGNYEKVHATPLRVGWADGFYIIRAPGGHIIGSTPSLEEVGQYIQLESEQGLGAVELHLTGHSTLHVPAAPTRQPPKGRPQDLSMEELLDILAAVE